MRKHITILSLIIFGIFFHSAPMKVFAVTTPSFPSCNAPQGSVRVSYSEGAHGIVGDMSTHIGADTVYTLSDSTLIQCFCAADGKGIQSNWWKASSLSDTDIQVLKNSGWYLVPNGSLWGLSNSPYMVKNTGYSCGGIGGGDILGLASTGNTIFLYGLVGIAVVTFLLGIILRRNENK